MDSMNDIYIKSDFFTAVKYLGAFVADSAIAANLEYIRKSGVLRVEQIENRDCDFQFNLYT